MTAILFLPFYAAIDGDGVPMGGAKLYFYQTGTTTPQNTYTDSGAGTPNANPVVADANGLFPPIYLAAGPDYKAILKTSADVTVATRDPIAAPAEAAASGGVVAAMQGRLSLVTGTPVMTSNQTGKTVVYYTPYIGNTLALWDGSQFVQTAFTELTNDLTAAATGNAGPAAAANNSNYDLFAWDDGGTVRLTRGPAWTSDTGRGSGGGTTELARVNGVLVNAQNISNGPSAGFGTYLGSIRTDGSAQANWARGGVGAGGDPALLNVWNMYNRVTVAGAIFDNTNSWNYTSSTARAANASNGWRVSFIQGMQDDFLMAEYAQRMAVAGTGASGVVGIGVNVTNAFSGRVAEATLLANSSVYLVSRHQVQALGFNFLQAVEQGDNSNPVTFSGDLNTTRQQSSLDYLGRF